jgi:hypothetical protein
VGLERAQRGVAVQRKQAADPGVHRLNRGGDRALNRAIHTIALTRMRNCPTTRAGLRRATHCTRQNLTRDPALSEAIHRPPAHRTLSATMPPPTKPHSSRQHLTTL